jgi:hypothetical protein
MLATHLSVYSSPDNVQTIGLLFLLIFSLQPHTYVDHFNQNHFTNYKEAKSVNNHLRVR